MKLKVFSFFTAVVFSLSTASVVSAYSVIPSGEAVGVVIKTDGLIVTDITQITNEDGKTVNAAYKAGVKKGDVIKAVDGNIINTNEDLQNYVQNRPQEIVLTILRNENIIHLLISPVKTKFGYKLGLWVRDSTAGIGTVTYIDPNTKSFAALGHGISDIDTEKLMPMREGNILKCKINSPTKGQSGIPGELNGVFSGQVLGTLVQNSTNGIFGNVNNIWSMPTVEIAKNDEITVGDAYILANVDGMGIKKYNIKIKKIYPKDKSCKNMVLQINDQNLISKTGGIIQGMSGAPIIQSGKLIGAVTHVFVNNPKEGYGIFISNMMP